MSTLAKPHSFASFRDLEQFERHRAAFKDPEGATTETLQELMQECEDEETAFWDDPMTAACGCGGELVHVVRRKYQGIFFELCRRGVLEYDGDAVTPSRFSNVY